MGLLVVDIMLLAHRRSLNVAMRINIEQRDCRLWTGAISMSPFLAQQLFRRAQAETTTFDAFPLSDDSLR